MLIFGSPRIDEAEMREVIATLKSGWIGTGPKVSKFEKNFKQYKFAKYSVAVNSCTAALHLSMIASNITHGNEVITTAMTFCSTVNTIIHAGGTPVLADINPLSMNIDPDEIRKKITSKTTAIIPVHFAGRACQMNEIMDIANEYNLIVIEDCAHAIETKYNNQHAGNFGDFGCFSFYTTKNIITGEGGMVIAKDENKANRIKVLALHGMSQDAWKRFNDDGYRHYSVTEAGFKYNMMDLQASIGIHQLQKVNEFWKRREKIWSIYNSKLNGLPLILPAPPEKNTVHAYHLYTILIDQYKTGISRDNFLKQMTKLNIGTGVHYLSIPEHPYYQKQFGWKTKNYPNAKRIGQQTVSLPLSAKLTDSDVDDVVNAIKEILNNA